MDTPCGCEPVAQNDLKDVVLQVVTDSPKKELDHLVDINFTPGQAPKITKVQPVAPEKPASLAESEAEQSEDGSVAVGSKPPPKRDPKTGKPVPPPAPPAPKEQVQIPAKTKPPSKEKALEQGNLELAKIKDTVRSRLNNGVAMSH